ncbi:S-layer homology domain-containing protein [bacterium]|nr:S-layer homology domain-containing protein [bacterium]
MKSQYNYVTSLLIVSVIAFYSSPLVAQNIKDVSTSDPGYAAVENAVKLGYLPLSTDNSFQADTPVTRKELALILDKILSGDPKTELTKAQYQELLALSKSFKNQAIQFDTIRTTLSDRQLRLDDDQKALQSDVSSLNMSVIDTQKSVSLIKSSLSKSDTEASEIEKIKKENSEQHLSIWVAIALSLVLGIIK